MKASREIRFVTSETKEKDGQGRTRYQGQLRHNTILNEKETRQLFAKFCNQHEPTTNMYIDSLKNFIIAYIGEGYHLDFGAFAVGLKLRGGFPGTNVAFDPKINSIAVEMTPRKEIKDAVENLKPVNCSNVDHESLLGFYQGRRCELRNSITPSGERFIILTGRFPAPNANVADEGFWLENEAGEKLLVGRLTESEDCHVEGILEGDIEPGERYWMVLQGRYENDTNLYRVKHRASVIQ